MSAVAHRRHPITKKPAARKVVRICLKELRESRCWLRIITKAELPPGERLVGLLEEATQLCNIIGRSIATATGK